jgi:hypothetical protein
MLLLLLLLLFNYKRIKIICIFINNIKIISIPVKWPNAIKSEIHFIHHPPLLPAQHPIIKYRSPRRCKELLTATMKVM